MAETYKEEFQDERAGLEKKHNQEDEDFSIRRAQFRGREFTREADGRWLDEWGAELVSQEGGFVIKPPPEEAWKTNSLARWAGREIPDPQWFAPDWIPSGQLIGLYGKPGSRKSTLILQLMIASVLGRGFGKVERLAQGPTYGLFCEDSEFEIARRARAMLKAYGSNFDAVKDCHAESLVHANLTTFVTFTRSGLMRTTPAWDKFLKDLDHIKPVLVGLDVVADFFGGNEINRGHVHGFCQLLDRTADERQFALMFSAHPSVRGVVTKSLRSGSTGWEGKTRALLTLQDPTDDNDEENELGLSNQSDRRILRLEKINYVKSGSEMALVFRDGRFVPEDTDPEIQKQKARAPIDDGKAEDIFIERLKKRLGQGQYVSPRKSNAGGDAAAALAGDGFTAAQLRAAQQRLFDKGVLLFDDKKRGVSRWSIHGSTAHTPRQQDKKNAEDAQ